MDLQKELAGVILEVYHQSFEQLRHFQSMSATHFNLFFVISGIAAAALVDIYKQNATASPYPAVFIGTLVWILGIFTLVRIVRWGGHTAHEINLIRRIHNTFASNWPLFQQLIPANPNLQIFVPHHRALFDRHRNNEPSTTMITIWASALFVAYELPMSLCIRIIATVVGITLPYLLWRYEIISLGTVKK